MVQVFEILSGGILQLYDLTHVKRARDFMALSLWIANPCIMVWLTEDNIIYSNFAPHNWTKSTENLPSYEVHETDKRLQMRCSDGILRKSLIAT